MDFYGNSLAGCCHLIFNSHYPYFIRNNIPEVNDLNVFQEFRRKKIASKILDELERRASKTSKYIGLGVGLYKDYGNAQRMYGKRGYIMDGNGVNYNNVQDLSRSGLEIQGLRDVPDRFDQIAGIFRRVMREVL